MEVKQLITFKVAAENLNFTKTAKQLNFAQSSVTAQIKSLEQKIGKPLFERLGKGLVLTDAGHRFKTYAEKIIRLSEEAISVVNETETSGILMIGAQESQLTYRLPAILRKFKAAYPKVKLVFKPAHSAAMARKQLMEGSLDIAFIMDKKESEDPLKVEELVNEEFKLVAAANHPFHSAFSMKDLQNETLLLTESGCSYRNMFKETLRSVDVYPLDQLEFASIEAIKQSVIAGLGVALLPEMAAKKELEEGRMKALPWHVSTSPIYTQLAWHKDRRMTPPLKSFIDLTRETFDKDKTNC